MADRNGYIGRAPSDSAVTVARQTFTPTGVTTDFTFQSGYTPGYFDLFLNGVKMIEGSDFTSSDGSTFSVLGGGASSGDILEAVAYKAFNAVTGIIGVRSEGTVISSNANVINFVGTGNTFALRGDTVDISINAGAAGTWANFDTNNVGITTSKKVRIQNDLEVTGVATAVNFSGNITGTAATFTTVNANLTGDVTGDVTGNADTATLATNAQGLSGTPNITVNNITGVAATFSGAVTVGGVLTYDDVTNVDSIGLITARSGIEFGSAGVGGTISALGHGEFVGVVTASALDAAISFWTLGADGSNHYTFTGPGDLNGDTDPDLQLIRGQKYVFKNRSGGHPFRIQSTPNGSTGTQYNDGVTNNDAGSGTDLIFDVPFDAPSILYYQCTSHGSMGGPIYIGSSSGDDVNVGAAITMYASSGIVSATSYFGSGANLTGIDAAPSITATASGAIGIGTAVSVNTDGTVSKVSGGSASVGQGSDTVFETGSVNSQQNGIAYDTTNNKVIIAYRDAGDSNAGKVVICDVSGTSITVGTPVEFASSADHISVAFDQNAGKFVVFYATAETNGNGKARVGTYSATNSATFGTEVNFNDGNMTARTAAVYDENAQKIVIAFRDTSDSNKGKAVVGTVSGTSITFGSETEYTGYINHFQDIAYNSVAQKVVICYCDANDSDKPKAIVGNVSGTSITFGSAVQLFGAACQFGIGVIYHVKEDRMLFIFTRDSPQSGSIIAGSVSGTTLSVTSGSDRQYESGSNSPGTTQTGFVYEVAAQKAVVFYDNGSSNGKYRVIGYDSSIDSSAAFDIGDEVSFESGSPSTIASVFDPDEEKIVTAYRDNGNFNRGTVIVDQIPYSHSTSPSFIGFSRAAYTNGQTATIDVVGSVNESQTGLSVGKMHYVQQDGSLGITTANPIVSAGVGLSTTRILVQPALQV